MPGTLLAEIATPSPVPHTSSARSALPSATSWAAATATFGYRLSTPRSITSASLCRSATSASLYSAPASSQPIAMRRSDIQGSFEFERVRDDASAEGERDGAGVGVTDAALGERTGAAEARDEVGGGVGGLGGDG